MALGTSNDPRWTLAGALRRAKMAHTLATGPDRPAIEARTGAAMIDGLGTDLVPLADAEAQAAGDLTQQKGATGGERATSQDAHDLVIRVRDAAARRAPADLEMHRALGVGDGVGPRSTSRVLAALDAIVRLGGTDASGLAPIGVLAADVEEAGRLATLLRGKDSEQRTKMTARASGTDGRTSLRLRVEAAVDAIGSAGQLAFRKDPVKRARFEALFATVMSEDAGGEPSPPEPSDPSTPPAAPTTPAS